MDFVRHWGTSDITSITLQHNTTGDEFQSGNMYLWHLKCAGDSVKPGDRAVGGGRKGTTCSDPLWQLMRWFTRLAHKYMLDPTWRRPYPPKKEIQKWWMGQEEQAFQEMAMLIWVIKEEMWPLNWLLLYPWVMKPRKMWTSGYGLHLPLPELQLTNTNSQGPKL